MRAVLLDTHAWVWSFADETRLSDPARAAMLGAERVCVSPISFFEIGQKVRVGKWPEMEPFAQRLPALLQDQGGQLAPFTAEICLRAALWDWEHRDPFDRLIAATASETGMPLITRDRAFDGLTAVQCRW